MCTYMLTLKLNSLWRIMCPHMVKFYSSVDCARKCKLIHNFLRAFTVHVWNTRTLVICVYIMFESILWPTMMSNSLESLFQNFLRFSTMIATYRRTSLATICLSVCATLERCCMKWSDPNQQILNGMGSSNTQPTLKSSRPLHQQSSSYQGFDFFSVPMMVGSLLRGPSMGGGWSKE